jgi:seryl-tRNA synthetase
MAILKSLDIPLGFSPRLGSAVYKTFLESLPYYLGYEYVVSVVDDRLLVEGVPTSLEQQVTQAALESLLAAQAEHERVEERCLQSFEGECSLHEGVYESLQQQGALFSTGYGKMAYSGVLADIFFAIDNFFKAHCLDLGAQQELYPPALEGDSLLRAGYFNMLAQHAYFIAPLRTSLDSLQAARDGTVLKESAEDHLQVPSWVLSPTVCHHCFEARKDSAIDLPLKVTAINQCSRYEVHDTHGMERLRIYWMREFIQFDREEKAVVDSLNQLLEVTTDTLQRWGVSHQVVTANDPFFSNSATSKRAFQSMFALKRELRLPVPGGSIACASFNNHQSSLVDSFGIQQSGTSSGKGIASGCVGWGYDRLLFGLFSQLGVDVSNWPAQVRNDLNL